MDDLRRAVAALYTGSTAHRAEADAYLKAARARDGFWVLALQLLSSPDAQERFFGANALRTLAQRGRELVVPEAGRTLAVELGRLTAEAAAAQQWPIANQLAGALGELAIRGPWWDVAGLVPDVLQLLGAADLLHPGAFPQQPNSQQQQQQQAEALPLEPARLQAALVALAALPEACQSRGVSVHPERRATAAAALAACAVVSHIVALALSQQPPALGVQLAALRLAQAWAGLPAAVGALQLPPGILAGLHQAVLVSPPLATQAAETVAALYYAAAAPGDPAALALLGQLLPHLNDIVASALHCTAAAAQQQQQQQQHSMQQLDAASTILAAAGAALAAQVCNPQVTATVGARLAQLWEALGCVAAGLLQLLQHPEPGVVLASLEPWDESLVPGLGRLFHTCADPLGQQQQQQHVTAADAQRARVVLEQLCLGLIRRMALPPGVSSAQATADARDMPDDVREMRRELADTFRATVDALGTASAVEHLLGEAVAACAAWQVGGDPSCGWHQLECCLYALNLVLPRHAAQHAQQSQQAVHQVQRAVSLCLAALAPPAPKLAGTALTLVGGLAEALATLESGGSASTASVHSSGGGSGGGGSSSLLEPLLAALLSLLESSDEKLARNAATTAHRLASNTRLAALLAARHAAWAAGLAHAYARRGGLQQAACGGDELSAEEFLLRALCALARAAQHAGQQGSQGAAGLLPGLPLQLVCQSASEAVAALAAVQPRLPASDCGAAAEPLALAAAAQQCSLQLEALALVLELGVPQGATAAAGSPGEVEQLCVEVCGLLQGTLHLCAPAPQLQQVQLQAQPASSEFDPLLRAACRVVAAAAAAVRRPSVLQPALRLLQPLVAAPPQPCVLEALQALVESCAAAEGCCTAAVTAPACAGGCAAPAGGGGSPAPCSGPCSEPARQQQAAAVQLRSDSDRAVASALQGSTSHAGDPDWTAAALRLGATAARARLCSAALLQQQLASLQQAEACCYHREVCEASLELAEALCSSPALGCSGAPDAGVGPEAPAAARVVLWLLLAASGVMPPFMVSPIAECLHGVWCSVGSDRFAAWLTQAVLQLAPADAPWRGWKSEAQQAALATLLSEPCQQDSKRFKRQLKALCGGKKKGAQVDVPARVQQ